MKKDLGIFQVCGVAQATGIMYPVTDDQDRSYGPKEKEKAMCEDCAFDAFESGEWESDDN